MFVFRPMRKFQPLEAMHCCRIGTGHNRGNGLIGTHVEAVDRTIRARANSEKKRRILKKNAAKEVIENNMKKKVG